MDRDGSAVYLHTDKFFSYQNMSPVQQSERLLVRDRLSTCIVQRSKGKACKRVSMLFCVRVDPLAAHTMSTLVLRFGLNCIHAIELKSS